MRSHSDRIRTMIPRSHTRLFVCLFVFAVALAVRLSIAGFSLPYIDHPDEPASYLKVQEWRGLYDMQGLHDGYPPAFLWLHWLVQSITDAQGPLDMAPTIAAMRILSSLATAAAAVFTALCAIVIVPTKAGWSPGLAALTAGLLWAIAPVPLSNMVFAIPDPFVYLFAVASAWCGLEAIRRPNPRRWIIASMCCALLAVLFKYSAAAFLGIGFGAIVCRAVMRPAERRLLIVTGVICAALMVLTVAGLFGIYRADLINTPGTSDVVRENGLSNLLNAAYITGNIEVLLFSAGTTVVLLAFVGIVSLAGVAAADRSQRGVVVSHLAITGFVIAAVPWSVSAFNPGSLSGIRFLLPALPVIMALAGAGVCALCGLISQRVSMPAGAIAAAGLAGLLLGPAAMASAEVIRDMRLPDSRVDLRTWADRNLEAGTVLVTVENHKTFNPLWGGIPYVTWFDWLQTDDLLSLTPADWQSQHGISYLAWTDTEHAPAGSPLLLGQFGGVGFRGPFTAMYRVEPLRFPSGAQFGNQIQLLGFDMEGVAETIGSPLDLRLFWEATAVPDASFSVFIHLTREDSLQPLAQADAGLCGSEQPSAAWTIGFRCFSPILSIRLPDDLAAGDYVIRAGVYDSATGQRLPLTNGEDGDSIVLLRLSVGGSRDVTQAEESAG